MLVNELTAILEIYFTYGHKKRQVTYIAPLQPPTLAVFRPWGIKQELVV